MVKFLLLLTRVCRCRTCFIPGLRCLIILCSSCSVCAQSAKILAKGSDCGLHARPRDLRSAGQFERQHPGCISVPCSQLKTAVGLGPCPVHKSNILQDVYVVVHSNIARAPRTARPELRSCNFTRMGIRQSCMAMPTGLLSLPEFGQIHNPSELPKSMGLPNYGHITSTSSLCSTRSVGDERRYLFE